VLFCTDHEGLAYCRETGDAAATRAQLATLFELAAFCTEAKLTEAALQLDEKDYSGVVALTAQVDCSLASANFDTRMLAQPDAYKSASTARVGLWHAVKLRSLLGSLLLWPHRC
jgi:hypothetical protein